MLQFKYPGVYTQELPSGAHAIAGAPTAVALFVGPTRSGIDGRRIRIQNFGEFERRFGGLAQTSSLSYSVLHFFANGGGEAFVVRVPPANSRAARSQFKADTAAGPLSLELVALSSGIAGNAIYVEFDPFGIGADPFGAAYDKTRFNLTLIDQNSGGVERFGGLTTTSDARSVTKVVNDEGAGSALVKVDNTPGGIEAPAPTGTTYTVGALPAGKFALDVKVLLNIAVLAANGAADAANSIAALPVTVFPKDSPRPIAASEFAVRVANALNSAIRANPAALAKMAGLVVDAQMVEGGKFLRLRVSPPGPTLPATRIAEATVTLANPPGNLKLLSTYGMVLQGAAAPSRFRLGATYGATGQVIVVAAPPAAVTPVAGADGDAAGQPDTDIFKAAVMDLGEVDPFFNLLCLPDLVRPSATDPKALHHAAAMSVYAEAALVCEKKHAFLLLDPPPSVTDTGSAENFRLAGIPFTSNHAAAYFPNIRVDDPLVSGAIRAHPPSGAMAGVIARTDGQYGVWQAPAGTEATLSGVYEPAAILSDEQHGVLNPLGVNVIRKFPIYGTVSFGARTLEGADAIASEWKYVPVRRTASYILRSLSEGLRWAVLKPNGEQLWSQMRMNVTAFMHGMFRQGAFKGTSAREAYFVQCDASTTTPTDMDLGIVNIVVGFAPLKPAEFVVISLRQIIQTPA